VAPSLETPQQHFGVAAGAEVLSFGLQGEPQLVLVVDLAVEHQRQGAVVAQHRLVA